LLPNDLSDTLSASELQHVLLHELVHIRRRDVLLNWVWISMQAWHWFNPVLWLAFRKLRAERELVCDAAVLACLPAGERGTYGTTLLRLASMVTERAPLPGLATVLDPKPKLERRIRMILAYRPVSWKLTATTAMLVATLTGVLFTRAAEKKADTPAAIPAPAPASKPDPAAQPGAKPSASTRSRVIQSLEEEMAKVEADVRSKQGLLNEWRVKLGITGDGEDRSGGPPTVFQRLQVESITAQTDYARTSALYRNLTNMNRAELRR